MDAAVYEESFQESPATTAAESAPDGIVGGKAGAPDRLADIVRRCGALSGLELVEAMIRDAFPGRIALLSSFGIEAAVLLDMVARVDPATPVLFLDTGMLFGQTISYRDRLQADLGLTDIRSIQPDPAALAESDPDNTLWQRNPDACCALRKVEPMQRALDGFDAWFTGRKRFHGGMRTELESFDMDADGRLKINPLAGWTRDTIDRYFKERELPRHPLADAGFTSVGCYPCTQPASDEKDTRSGRWAGSDKTECGIHYPFWNGF